LSVMDRVSRGASAADSLRTSDSGLVGVITEPFQAENDDSPQRPYE
jgi:hypothetical protein